MASFKEKSYQAIKIASRESTTGEISIVRIIDIIRTEYGHGVRMDRMVKYLKMWIRSGLLEETGGYCSSGYKMVRLAPPTKIAQLKVKKYHK